MKKASTVAAKQYNGMAKSLHWLILLLLILQFAVAWTMPDIHRDSKPVGLIAWHLSIGVVILLVTLLRLGWRAVSAVPPPPADLLPSLRLLSRATHFLLYAILIVLPLLGWINANARGWAVWFLGWVPFPTLVTPDSPWGAEMGDVHQIVAYLLIGVAMLHVSGAIYHQFVLKDDLVSRMLPMR